MSSKLSFKDLMKQRHSTRCFLSKPIPEDILKDIIETSLASPSWCNSQAWSIYVSSGKIQEKIREEWIAKNKEGIKGYADIHPGHRTDCAERCQNSMKEFFDGFKDLLKDPDTKQLWNANFSLFNAPTIVYLTVPKKRTNYSLLDIGAIEMAIILASKDYGIDSIPAYEAVKYPDILRKHLKIPEDEDIYVGISLGYADPENPLNQYRAKRLTLNEACHFFS